MPDSIFTKIIQREIPADIVYEDDEFISFRDINPKAPIHVLIVTKKPYQTLEEIPVSDTKFHANLLLTARKVAKKLGIEGDYKLHMNVGKHVQVVHHIHIHLLGGWNAKNDLSKTGVQL